MCAAETKICSGLDSMKRMKGTTHEECVVTSAKDLPVRSNTNMMFAKFVQGLIIAVTFGVLYYKNNKFDKDLKILNYCMSITSIFQAFILINNSNHNHRFELIYSIYLPFILSFCFNRSLTIINTILSLNVINYSYKNFNKSLIILTQILCCYVFDDHNINYLIIAIFMNFSLSAFLQMIGELKSLDYVDCNLFSILLTNIFYFNYDSISVPFRILHGTLSALFYVIIFNYVIFNIAKNWFNSHRYILSLVQSSVIIGGFPLLTNYFIHIPEQKSPLEWLLNYITDSPIRQYIFIGWLTLVATLVPTFMMFQSNVSLNTSRKVWHFLIFLMIIIPFKYDSEFVKIALAGIIPLFLCIEYIRYLKLEPMGAYLDLKLRSFADERDLKGPLIISYIYLILGISFPLLIYNSPVGLISLGIGDSLASIVGKKMGRYHWPQSDKTIEGTIAFVSSTFIICKILQSSLNYFQNISTLTIAIMCLLSGILEGNSILNDNILIPSFMLICEYIFTD
ncbi:similar to Saccharomyces cerevisiae YMR013C SEC59 Dolichol kinase, catalyzes the terminal step in dolichyl monophosphate (Dol-P) biosynthesis [Maudiozyma saulgeensis]|uniref:dolichol kinase n=1 Tax=Maudiozyma saulgeensis TaxID=1789683 RepID=A0A1X7R7Y5_9SACH|nr:similar to Saccharomyces cerevisiae YMR013C SEC59 Dolichol kinase, catalyzes the terminal step in dolichyl monophosphate (Dol-P) biosynthesis [Kazachstania saulgeensis]